MKNLIILILLLAFCYKSLDKAWNADTSTETPLKKEIGEEVNKEYLPAVFKKLPLGDNVYLSSGYTTLKTISTLREKGVKTNIRLNGNGHDAKGQLSINKEAIGCYKSRRIHFYYYNIDGGDPIDPIVDQLNNGNVVIHCKNGAHRAPLVAGCFLLSKGMEYKEVIKVIGWEKIQFDDRYKVYVDALKQRHKKYRAISSNELN